ncbi:TcpQ domain-containing protein [Pseudomonas phytophila]|uniref:TcpQ domain-containing protein n=1 Tax=Pseudomonas phytophila TaxID=2867264 RepID=A0ABY6FME7_9PSED|nr:TcpQ domain-containing protein [Pseudomonas phytophila]UXZ99088.1 TcpQ domain-containing protein [Pseudomonas phytophila]
MIRQLSVISVLALIAGCAQQETKAVSSGIDESRNPELLTPDLYQGSKGADASNVRYSRYTVVNTSPGAEQRDLMSQIIDVSIPGNMRPSVQDAMQYVVDRSGYSLCPSSTEHVNILYTRPLPAAQYKLGPMTLRDTLQVLAGPAWQVKVNEVTRGVCFVLRPGYQLPDSPKPAAVAQTSLPVSVGSASVASTTSPVTVLTAPATGAPFSKDSTPGSLPPVKSGTQPAKQLAAPISSRAKEGTPIQLKLTAVAKSKTTPTPSAPSPVSKAVASISPGLVKPEPVVPPVAAVALQQHWEAPVGSTLRQSVEDWAKRAGWQVIWVPEDLDYPIEAPLRFTGSFSSAISQIFPLYDNAKRSFVVDGSEGQGQSVLHVSERRK